MRKKLLYWVIGISAALLVLVIAIIMLVDPIMKKVTERRIKEQTGLQAEIGRLRIKFNPASVNLSDIKIHNPKEFGESLLLDIPEFFLEVDGEQARLGKLRFKEIRFNLKELNVIKNKDGRFNHQALDKDKLTNSISSAGLSSTVTKSARGLQFAGIEKLYLTLGKMNYIDLREPSRNEAISLGVTNEVFEHIKSEQDFKNWSGGFGVRMLLQIITEQMMNGPERSQSFSQLLKEIRNSTNLALPPELLR